jgi:membrane associated rhomboid family serine protease
MASYCYRHTNRETGVSCSNCGRPICPECMTPTSVGMRCPECARQKTQVRRMPTGPSLVGADRWSMTNILIAINVVAFLVELASGVTLGGADRGSVFYHGALYGPAISDAFRFPPGYALAGHDQYWRLLTSGFLHEGLLHIGLNMLSLWFVGRALEPAVGKRNFLAIYLAALLAGSFGALVFEPQQPTVGASGAIFGVFGALIVLAYRRGISIWQTGLAPILLINLFFDLTQSGISIGGHIGGLIAGVICGFAFTDLAERRRKPAWALVVCLIVACVSVIGAIAVAGGTGLTPTGFTI